MDEGTTSEKRILTEGSAISAYVKMLQTLSEARVGIFHTVIDIRSRSQSREDPEERMRCIVDTIREKAQTMSLKGSLTRTKFSVLVGRYWAGSDINLVGL